jgi:hypothetical protein
MTTPAADVKCARCEQSIQPRQNVMFRRDGRVEHLRCLPVVKQVAPTADVICPACSAAIERSDGAVKEGTHVLHLRCFIRRPIAGGSRPSAWTIIAEEHAGIRRGITPEGHRELIAACAETLSTSVDVVVRARYAVAISRVLRAAAA